MLLLSLADVCLRRRPSVLGAGRRPRQPSVQPHSGYRGGDSAGLKPAGGAVAQGEWCRLQSVCWLLKRCVCCVPIRTLIWVPACRRRCRARCAGFCGVCCLIAVCARLPEATEADAQLGSSLQMALSHTVWTTGVSAGHRVLFLPRVCICLFWRASVEDRLCRAPAARQAAAYFKRDALYVSTLK